MGKSLIKISCRSLQAQENSAYLGDCLHQFLHRLKIGRPQFIKIESSAVTDPAAGRLLDTTFKAGPNKASTRATFCSII